MNYRLKHAGEQLAGSWPRNPVQFALKTKAASSLVFFRGKNHDLCVHHQVFIAKAKRFLIEKKKRWRTFKEWFSIKGFL